MVWDRGTYELTPAGDPVEAVRKGKIPYDFAWRKSQRRVGAHSHPTPGWEEPMAL